MLSILFFYNVLYKLFNLLCLEIIREILVVYHLSHLDNTSGNKYICCCYFVCFLHNIVPQSAVPTAVLPTEGEALLINHNMFKNHPELLLI